MQREYKTDTPGNTIERITRILKHIDITAHQEVQKSVDGHLFSCQYSLDGTEFLAQNGKGTSMDYAVAGALAELMERMQNLLIFNSKIGLNNIDILRVIPDMIKIDNLDALYSLNDDKCELDIQRVCKEVMINPSGSTIRG